MLQFAMDRGLGFQLSPEIVGTTVNPALRDNEAYRQLIDRTLEMKRSQRGVLGVPEYLVGIRDFSAFRCYPLLMPVIRPDGCMYYPCLEWKQARDQPAGGGQLLSGVARWPGSVSARFPRAATAVTSSATWRYRSSSRTRCRPWGS